MYEAPVVVTKLRFVPTGEQPLRRRCAGFCAPSGGMTGRGRHRGGSSRVRSPSLPPPPPLRFLRFLRAAPSQSRSVPDDQRQIRKNAALSRGLEASSFAAAAAADVCLLRRIQDNVPANRGVWWLSWERWQCVHGEAWGSVGRRGEG